MENEIFECGVFANEKIEAYIKKIITHYANSSLGAYKSKIHIPIGSYSNVVSVCNELKIDNEGVIDIRVREVGDIWYLWARFERKLIPYPFIIQGDFMASGFTMTVQVTGKKSK